MSRFENNLTKFAKKDFLDKNILDKSLQPVPIIKNFVIYQYYDIISLGSKNEGKQDSLKIGNI